MTALLAVLAQRAGYKTAILDADVTGPSIPKAFGIKEPAMGNEEGIEALIAFRLDMQELIV